MNDWKDQLSQLVYSTDQGKVPASETPEEVPQGDGIVRLQRQTKGRKGKGVTIVTGLQLADKELKALAKQLKQQCGVGGSVKDYTIELQGDQRDTLQTYLEKKGYTVKQAGG